LGFPPRSGTLGALLRAVSGKYFATGTRTRVARVGQVS